AVNLRCPGRGMIRAPTAAYVAEISVVDRESYVFSPMARSGCVRSIAERGGVFATEFGRPKGRRYEGHGPVSQIESAGGRCGRGPRAGVDACDGFVGGGGAQACGTVDAPGGCTVAGGQGGGGVCGWSPGSVAPG